MDDLPALFETWWPMLGAGAAGVLLGLLLGGRLARRTRRDEADDRLPEAASPEALPDPPRAAPTGQAAPAQAAATQAAPAAAVAPLTIEALLAEGERGDTAAHQVAQPFATFERDLNDWQELARASAGATGADGVVGAALADESVDDWDNLMDIDGVDFDLARHLYAQGIHTLEKVASLSVAELRAVLDLAGERHRSVDPSSWPASARRAIEQR